MENDLMELDHKMLQVNTLEFLLVGDINYKVSELEKKFSKSKAKFCLVSIIMIKVVIFAS